MKKSKKTQQPRNYDSFIQTLQNLRREADENTKKNRWTHRKESVNYGKKFTQP